MLGYGKYFNTLSIKEKQSPEFFINPERINSAPFRFKQFGIKRRVGNIFFKQRFNFFPFLEKIMLTQIFFYVFS